MFAKKAIAALLIAAVPLTAATYANAASSHHNGSNHSKYSKYKKSKNGKSYAAKKVVGKTVSTTTVKRSKNKIVTTKRTTTTSKNGNKKTTIITKYVTKPFGEAYKNGFGLKKYWTKSGKAYGYLAGKKYGIWTGKTHSHKNNSKCVAAAKKHHGNGSRIWGVSGKKYGHNACERAMNECRSELRHRKSRGKNPNARCVIVSRG